MDFVPPVTPGTKSTYNPVRKNGATSGRYQLLTLALAEAICDAFELYREFVPEGQLSFEQAFCLVKALWTRDEIGPATCEKCGALILVDLLSLYVPLCAACAEPSASS